MDAVNIVQSFQQNFYEAVKKVSWYTHLKTVQRAVIFDRECFVVSDREVVAALT